MRKFLLAFIVLITVKNLPAQEWTQMMHTKDGNFYPIQQAFNEFWDRNDKSQKGRGYSVFKRWEHHVAPRVYPSGDLSLIGQNLINFQHFLQNNPPANNGNKQIGQGAVIASTTWSLVGPLGAMTGSAVNGLPRKAGRDNFITFHPSAANTYWAGAPAGGLWSTTNNGTTWTTNTDNLTVIGCSDLAVDPTNTNIMYLATGDGDAGDTPSIGVLKSTNGGATWAATGLSAIPSNNLLIRRLIINPTNPQILIAATNAGIYRTVNGGTNWTQVSGINCYDVEFKPGDPNTVYAAATAFYLSTNGGGSFAQITNGIPNTGSNRMAVAVTTNSLGLNYVYVVASSSANSGLLGVYRSINSGTSFSLMANSPDLLANSCLGTGTGGQGWYDLAIAASPLNANEVVVGGVNHWRSTNGGSTWTNIGCWNSTVANPPYVHADVHDLEYTSAGVLYSANDGGVYEYNGTLWIDRTGTRNIAQIYRIGLSTLSPNMWITGHQDNGSNIYNGVTYNASYPGDGLDCFIDRTNNNRLFTETPNGGLVKTTNGGASWTSASTGITGTSNWLCPWKQDPQATGTTSPIYCGFNTIWKSTDQGNSWVSLAALPIAAGSVVEFAIAPTNSLVLYVVKSSGVFYTSNGGTSWTNITGTLPVGSAALTNVAIDMTDPNTAWVTFSGYSAANKVFMTTNAGTSWTNVTTNLPNLPANCVMYEPGSNDRIYVGMDVGVYYKDNANPNWTLYNTGLPNTVISELETSPASPTRMRAATYGRGVYEVDFPPCPNGPTVTISASSASICAGASATLTASGASVYAWSTGANLPSIVVTPTLTTVYTVTGSVGACTDIKSFTLIVGPALSLSVTATPTAICGGGSSTLTVSGAASYTWSTGSNAASIVVSPTISTTYTVNGSTGSCSGSTTKLIAVGATPTITVNNQTICAGAAATLVATGAATYTWNTGATTSSIVVSPTINTTYTVVGNSAGCSSTKTVSVNVSGSINLSVNSLSLCAGNSGVLTASGATSYTWSTGSNSPSITVSPIASTPYTVTGSNGSCFATQTLTVLVTPAPSITVTASPGGTICSGSSSTLSVLGGACTYTWNPGSLTGSSIVVSPVSSVVYTVIASCGGCGTSGTVGLTVNQAPTLAIAPVSPTICQGGSVFLTATGASSYTWNTGATQSVLIVSPTVTTTYTVTGANGNCTGNATRVVTVFPSPTITIANQTICAGGTATLVASGANTYTWNTGVTSPTLIVSPLTSTTYVAAGTSSAGCVASKLASVTIGANLSITVNTLSICSGASGTLTASGATSYTWSTGSNATSIVVSPSTTSTYSVIGANGACSGTTAVTVSVTATPNITITTIPAGTVCAGNQVTLVPTGACTYTYNTGSANVSPSVTTVYSVTGSCFGCSGTQTISVPVQQPAPINITLSSASVCAGASATLTGSGANTYTWNTGVNGANIVVNPSVSATYSVAGNSGACTNTGSIFVPVVPFPTLAVNNQTICTGTNATLSVSGAAGYTWSTGSNATSIVVSPTASTVYTVSGNNFNCVNSSTVSVTIGNFLSVFALASPSNICAGGSAVLSASGANSYTWSTGANTSTISVSPGTSTTYTVNGSSGACAGSTVITVSVNSQPTLTVISSAAGVVCSGSTVTLTAAGAASYSWNTGGTGNQIVISPTASIIYTVTGFNGGCGSSATVAVSVGAGSLNLSVSANPPAACAGGSVTLIASGANSYTWSTGATSSVIVVSPSVTSTYSLTGANGGCTGNNAITVSVTTAPALSVSISPSATLCLGKSVILTAIGNYSSFVWSSPTINGSVAVVTPTANTSYTVLASGAAGGCTNSTVVALTLTTSPQSILSSTNPPCSNPCTGAVSAVTTGGTPPYSYILSGTSCTAIPCTNLCQGLYTLNTADALGCTSFNIFSIACTGIDTGIKGVTGDNEIKVFPNPAHDKLYIESTGKEFGYVLYNNLGQLITSGKNIHGLTSIDLSNYAKGIYLVQLHTEEGMTVHKIIVE